MTRPHHLQLRLPPLADGKLAPYRFGRVGDRVVITNDAGYFHLLTQAEHEDLLGGRILAGHPLFEPLRDKGFLGDHLDVGALADRLRQKKTYVGQGPHLHIVICTLRCNQSCKYCHASRTAMDQTETDMSLDTAKQVVDHAMQSPSPYLNFEFQGGEPTLNMPVVKFIVDYSREKNRFENKDLEHSIVTNLTHLDEATADWLVDNEVLVCASLDGPQELHDYNRPWKAGESAYQQVRKWITYFNERYAAQGKDPQQWHVDALMTTSRKTFDHWKEVIDLYVELGLHTIHLRPLSPYGFAVDTWKQIGYSTAEYIDFYRQALDYIIELNLQGTELVEG
ncbi:MAG: radical SAM protein, partial [Deltaproteobacteria bacterium]|nr:radical SAM protein [Deltaproteobacteria bacterium]